MFASRGNNDIDDGANPKPNRRLTRAFRLAKTVAMKILHRPTVLFAKLRWIKSQEARIESLAERSAHL